MPSPSKTGKRKKRPLKTKAGGLTLTEVAELEDLRRELERKAGGSSPSRWNANPDDVQRSVAHLVLTLVEFIRQFRVDIGLIGISSIEPDGTLRDFDYREVKVARAIIEHSRQVWLVADHSKFNRPAMVELAHLNHIDCLYTDRAPPEPYTALLAEADVRCVVAED